MPQKAPKNVISISPKRQRTAALAAARLKSYGSSSNARITTSRCNLPVW